MELWQRFTHLARRTILIAHDEASQMRMHLIGTEHLLLGLIRLGEGPAVEILRSLDVDLGQLLAEVRRSAEMGHEDAPTDEISFTPEAQHVLQVAYGEAREMGDHHIGTEHLLLGLTRDERGAAYRALHGHGVDAEKVREAIAQTGPRPQHARGLWRALRGVRKLLGQALQRLSQAEESLSEIEEAPRESIAVGGAEGEIVNREVLSSERIPPAVGPYSQAVRAGDFLFCSGVVGLSPETGKLVEGAFADEVRQVMSNLGALLEDCGSGLNRVVKTTVFLADMGQFQEFNGIYAEYFDDAPPARSTIQVAALPLGARLEVEAIALA